MLLTTSPVAVGQLSPKKQYTSNVFSCDKPREYIEVSRFDVYIKSLKEKSKPVACNSLGDAYHSNYMDYLEICWSDHLGAVFTPDILWYSILCEITLIIKDTPDKFRSLFTTSDKKKTIKVYSESDYVIPMDSIVEELTKLVPADSSLFLPQFSTSTTNSIQAFNSAFADMASPYYDYAMYCCGIPLVDVRGSESDYRLIIERVNGLIKLFVDYFSQDGMIWLNKLKNLCEDIYDNLNSNFFWSEMFSLERCGSGGQVEVSGWWRKLFNKQPSVAFTYNFSTHLSTVEYKNLTTDKEFKMLVGLLSSKLDNILLVPDFGYMVFNKE